MAARAPPLGSRAARPLVVLECAYREPQLRGHVGAKVGGPAKPIVLRGLIEGAEPLPDSIELRVEWSPTGRCRLHTVQGCADLGRSERYRVRFAAELAFCRAQLVAQVVSKVVRNRVGHRHRQPRIFVSTGPRPGTSLPLLRIRHICGVAALLLSGACHVWKPTELGPTREFLNGRARIERTDGTIMVMRGPRLVGDSVVGTHERTPAHVALARADVRRIEVEQIDRGRTAAAGAGLVLLYWAYLAMIAMWPTDPY